MAKTSKKTAKTAAAREAKGLPPIKATAASKAKAAAIRASLAKPAKGEKPLTAHQRGTTANKPGKPNGPRPESKLAICAALLTRKEGCTTRDLLTATSWPAISVPATAKAAGLKLRKEKTKGHPTTYFAVPA